MKKITNKIFSIILILAIFTSSTILEVSAVNPVNSEMSEIEKQQNEYVKIVEITGEENIRKYLSETGREYDPTIIAIYRTIYDEQNNVSESNKHYSADMLRGYREYEVRNQSTATVITYDSPLREYRRPAGKITISEGISISTVFSAKAGIGIEDVEVGLGYSIERSKDFRIEWSQTYSSPVLIRVYAIYNELMGELWDNDVWDDDFIGIFKIRIPIGDEITVKEV